MPEPAVASEPAELSGNLDTAQLDAILNEVAPIPADDGAGDVGPAIPDGKTAAPAAAEPGTPPVKKEEPVKVEKPTVEDPYAPPPEVAIGEKPPVEKVDDDPYGTMPEEPPPFIKSEKNKAEFKTWRQNHEKLKTDLRALQAAAKTKPEQDPGLMAQIEDLSKRNAQQNAIIERLGAEHLPYVQTNFNEPREAAIKEAEEALEMAKIDPAAIRAIVGLPKAERMEALDEILSKVESRYVEDQLTGAFREINKLEKAKTEFLADREGNVKAMTQAEQAERSRQIIESEKKLVETVNSTIELFAEKHGYEFLKKSNEPGYENWNARIDADTALIHELAIKNKDPQRFLNTIVAGVEGVHYRVAWQSERTKRLAAEAKVAEFTGVLPGMAGKPKPSPGETGASDGMDPDMVAAGVLPSDDLETASRKLGHYLNSKTS